MVARRSIPVSNDRVTIGAHRCTAVALFLGTGLCLLGGVVPSAVAAPKNVLILSEGPLLPYGAVLRENTIAGLV